MSKSKQVEGLPSIDTPLQKELSSEQVEHLLNVIAQKNPKLAGQILHSHLQAGTQKSTTKQLLLFLSAIVLSGFILSGYSMSTKSSKAKPVYELVTTVILAASNVATAITSYNFGKKSKS